MHKLSWAMLLSWALLLVGCNVPPPAQPSATTTNKLSVKQRQRTLADMKPIDCDKVHSGDIVDFSPASRRGCNLYTVISVETYPNQPIQAVLQFKQIQYRIQQPHGTTVVRMRPGEEIWAKPGSLDFKVDILRLYAFEPNAPGTEPDLIKLENDFVNSKGTIWPILESRYTGPVKQQ